MPALLIDVCFALLQVGFGILSAVYHEATTKHQVYTLIEYLKSVIDLSNFLEQVENLFSLPEIFCFVFLSSVVNSVSLNSNSTIEPFRI